MFSILGRWSPTGAPRTPTIIAVYTRSQNRKLTAIQTSQRVSESRFARKRDISDLNFSQPSPSKQSDAGDAKKAAKADTYRIADMQVRDRPRERLATLGPESLSSAELIGILLRVGVRGENAVRVGQRLLHTFGGISGLHQTAYSELISQRGIGTAKAAQLKAAIELGRRLIQESPAEKPSVHSPQDAAALIQYDMSAFEQEHLRVMHLNTRNRVLGWEDVYKGSLNQSQVRIGEIFKGAIRRNAASIIIAQNHPSGDPSPSPDDVAITRAIIEAGRLLDVEVLDHLIIGRGRYISLKEKRLAFME